MKTSEKIIWILEEDSRFQSLYEECLGIRYQIKIFDRLGDFRESLADLPKRPFDLLIVDLKLKDMSFVAFVNEEGKNARSRLGLYIVISSSEDIDVVRWCFKHGALDYLTKPIKKNELIVKVERILGNSSNISSPGLTDVQVDVSSLVVQFQGTSSPPLTLKEYQIFQAMSVQPDHSATRFDIIKKVWRDIRVTEKAFDVHLVNLRRKLLEVGVEIIHQAPDRYKVLIAQP